MADEDPVERSNSLSRIRKRHEGKKDLVHPEMTPSTSGMCIEYVGNKFVWCLQVKGLGVIWMSASELPQYDDPRGRLRFNGLAVFTEDEIRHGEITLDR